MSNILGINFSHDSSVTLISNGKVLFSIEEEKVSRTKQDYGWPLRAINHLFENSPVKRSEIDFIAFGGNIYSMLSKNEIQYRFRKDKSTRNIELFSRIVSYAFSSKRNFGEENKTTFEQEIQKQGFSKAKVVFCDHHLSHAASAYYCAPMDIDLVITCDGYGDQDSFVFFKPTDKGLEILHRIPYDSSIGSFYSCITVMLGFRAMRHEGKITGLAAYGKPTPLLEEFRKLFFHDETGMLRRYPGNNIDNSKKEKVISLLPLKNRINIKTSSSDLSFDYSIKSLMLLDKIKELSKSYSKEDVAFACQKVTEELVVAETKSIIKKHFDPSKKLSVALAGGVFANVRVNQMIYEMPEVNNVFVQPAMGDSGTSLGAAILTHLDHDNKANKKERSFAFKHTYIGPDYTGEVAGFVNSVDRDKYEVTEMAEPAKQIAKMMAENVIVGFWSGSMEWGPRALGKRSIILNTFDKSVNDSLNERLSRTEFMPFAPSIVDYMMKEYIPSYDPTCPAADYMTITYDVKKEHHEKLQAVVHVDGTARPQSVSKETNPYYHAIIDEFYKITGCGAIVNTSFNAHEEPIVSSPASAFKALLENRIDVLVLDHFLISPKAK